MNGDGMSIGVCMRCGWSCTAPGGDTWQLLAEHGCTGTTHVSANGHRMIDNEYRRKINAQEVARYRRPRTA